MSLSISTSSRNLWATISRASSGHAWNQSMVQQLIRDGNWRSRFRNASPIGLKATTMCRFSLQRATKKANRVKGLNSKFLLPAWASGRIVWGRRDEVKVRFCCEKKLPLVRRGNLIETKNGLFRIFNTEFGREYRAMLQHGSEQHQS